jgi:hypothetical protein
VRIEQDWEVVVGTPDADQPSPQVAVQIDPFPGSRMSCVFLVNYQDDPSFQGGGVSLQIWKRQQKVAFTNQAAGVPLKTAGETISWTQFMQLSGGHLNFGISKGTSATWGPVPIGGWTISTPYSYLNTFTGYYDTSDSVAKSGVLLGGQPGVASLKLKAVRKYDAEGNHDDESGQQLYP